MGASSSGTFTGPNSEIEKLGNASRHKCKLTISLIFLFLLLDLQEGEASLAAGAGPFLERGGERDHWLGKEITNRLHPL